MLPGGGGGEWARLSAIGPVAPEGGGTPPSRAQPARCPLPLRPPPVRSARAPRPRAVHSPGPPSGHSSPRQGRRPTSSPESGSARLSVPSRSVAKRTRTAGVALGCSPLSLLACPRVAANSDKFFPLNTWVPQWSFLSFHTPQNRSLWTTDPCCHLCLKYTTFC